MTSGSPSDERLADGSEAPQRAFIVHGHVLTLMGLVARLAVAGQLEALRALDHATHVHLHQTGTRGSPGFEMVIESDEDAWSRLEPHTAAMERHLNDISSCRWVVRRSLPLSISDRTGTYVLSREGIVSALADAHWTTAAKLAERATSFQVRPRPGSGRHIVTVYDPDVLTENEVRLIDEGIFRVLQYQTDWTLSPGFDALARRLAPSPAAAQPARVAVVTSVSEAMVGDTEVHLEVFETTWRKVRVNDPDAPTRLAETLAELWALRPPEAVLIARGGGDAEHLARLATAEVRHEIERLRARGTFVVVAFGHGDFHVDLGADVHARTPTSGAEIIRRKFHEAPEAQRLAYANHKARIDALRFDGGDAPIEVARGLVEQLRLIEEETVNLIDRHRQDDPGLGAADDF
jgi:hypothetical protein